MSAQKFSVERFFTAPLVESGEIFDAQHDSTSLSQEFLGGAATYDARYFDGDYLLSPLGEAFAAIDLPRAPVVLDLGSGSGSSVVPTLKLLPLAQVVATDLSPQLLHLLRRRLLDAGLAARCAIVRVDLSRENLLRDNSFDLVIGNSILHHLLRPDELLRQLFRWLRRGGHAIFIEPFAAGQFCFALLCELLAGNAAQVPGLSAVADLLRRVANDIRVRLSRAVPYEDLEDKWLFTREYLETAIAGLGEVSVVPLDASPGLLVREMKKLLRHGLGLEDTNLPAWIWQQVQAWDAAYAPLAQELPLLGRIILKRI